MKTTKEIHDELEQIQKEIKFRLELFLKDNPDISVNMEFNTQCDFVETICGKRELYSKGIKSDMNIRIDSFNNLKTKI